VQRISKPCYVQNYFTPNKELIISIAKFQKTVRVFLAHTVCHKKHNIDDNEEELLGQGPLGPCASAQPVARAHMRPWLMRRLSVCTGFERQSSGSALQRPKAEPVMGRWGLACGWVEWVTFRMGHTGYGSTCVNPRMDSCRLIECDVPLTVNRPLYVKYITVSRLIHSAVKCHLFEQFVRKKRPKCCFGSPISSIKRSRAILIKCGIPFSE